MMTSPCRTTASFLVLLMLLTTAGCGAVVVGGSAAALGTYAYVNGQIKGAYNADIETIFDASVAACKELGIPVIKERKDGQSGEVQGTLSGDRVTIAFKLIGDNITEVTVRVGMLGDEGTSRRIHNAISQRL